MANGKTQNEARVSSGFGAVLHSVGSRCGILVINAVTGVITARTLGPQGRGELAAMIIWSLFLASATTLGIPSAVIYFLRRHPVLKRDLAGSAMFMSLLLGLIAGMAGWFVLPSWLHKYSSSLIRDAQWFLLLTPICALGLTGRAILEATEQFGSSNFVQMFSPAVTLIGLIVLWFTGHTTPLTAGLCYTLAAVPTFAVILSRLQPGWFSVAAINGKSCRMLLGYGIRSYGVDLLGTLALQVDQVLVVNLLSAKAMGSYVVILSLSRMLNLFQNSVVMVLFPKATGRDPHEVLAVTSQAARISTLVTTVCAAAVCLCGPLVLRVLYGAEYMTAVGALRILLVEVTLSGLVFVLAQAYMALARPGLVTVLQAIGLAFSIPLMLWLIPSHGVVGASVALLVSTVVRLCLVVAGFPLILKTPLPQLLPRQADLSFVKARLPGGAAS